MHQKQQIKPQTLEPTLKLPGSAQVFAVRLGLRPLDTL